MKVLIISHNPISTKTSIGKTLLSLFSEFKKEELCQLYVHRGLPEGEHCHSYYQITDKAALRGILTRSVAGKMVESLSSYEENSIPEDAFYQKVAHGAKKRNPSRELTRDFIWKLAPWYNTDLQNWISQERPECIFVALGSGKFLYDMALKISKEFQLPIVSYVCDDFYFMKSPQMPLGKLWKKLLIKKSNALFEHTDTIVSICPEMSELYGKHFGRPAVTVMTGSHMKPVDRDTVKEEIETLRYFGKLSLNRYRSMAEICKVLDLINQEQGTSYAVEIFTGDLEEEEKSAFKDIGCVKFFAFVTGAEFVEKFTSSDILIHVEGFDQATVDRVRYSVSTKIADSLASGIPLFAYGPADVASIQHLLRNHAGAVAVSTAELKEKLLLILQDSDERKKISEYEIMTAKQYHDSKYVSRYLRSILYEKFGQ